MAGILNFGARRKCHLHEGDEPISSVPFVVIDTELTGLNERKDSIVSVGAVRMAGPRISLGDPFYRLIKPRAALTRESVIIHGIMPSDVAAQADSASVLAEFASFCGQAVLVGHCLAIDLAFLDREMKRVLDARIENRLLDTAELFGWMMNRGLLENCDPAAPGEPDLYRLARWLDIPVSETHHALTDAYITAQVFQRFLPLLRREGISTVGELVRIGDPLGGGDRFRIKGEISSL
ncbi:MAG: hypothetical protein A2010_12990 [Nitrospirae bacterium GWD2_57_9]|nr:MAG: hypothetical protein A2010_12990 [Nitrospirae bacterium GWD2_57_9]OGW47174.1 MAG: hypothetical protein A2078_08000 [Nitrospirae bacterium GWC2_57_9]